MHQRRTSLVALAAGGRLVLMAVLLFVAAPAAGLAGAWVGAMARTVSMVSESAAAYAIGRRYVGRAVAPPAAARRSGLSRPGPPEALELAPRCGR